MNGGEFLSRALAAVAGQTFEPVRTIVVDNASTDGSVEMVRREFPWVEVLGLGENVGFAAANNAGARTAQDCEWVALLNPDAFPAQEWLETLLRAAELHPDCASFASQLRRADEPALLDGAGDVYHVSGLSWRREYLNPVKDGARDGPSEVFSACAAAALYRRDAFLEVGGLDEDYFVFYCDTDLTFRLRLRGYRCLYVPDAVVHHVGSATTGAASDFTLYHTHRNLVWTFAKDMPWPLLLLYLPQHLLLNLGSIVLHSRRGQARPVLAAKRDAVRGLPALIRKRRQVQSRRRVEALTLWRLMARGRSVLDRGRSGRISAEEPAALGRG